MDIKFNATGKINLGKLNEQQSTKPEVATQQERPNYNQGSLDKMASFNRSMVKQVSFGGWSPESKENEKAK